MAYYDVPPTPPPPVTIRREMLEAWLRGTDVPPTAIVADTTTAHTSEREDQPSATG